MRSLLKTGTREMKMKMKNKIRQSCVSQLEQVMKHCSVCISAVTMVQCCGYSMGSAISDSKKVIFKRILNETHL
jgi:hypothetical protein